MTILVKVTAAINQLPANQSAIIQQMAAMSFIPPPSIAVWSFNITPIQKCNNPHPTGIYWQIIQPRH